MAVGFFYLTISEAQVLFGELRDAQSLQFREFPGPAPRRVWIPIWVANNKDEGDWPEHYVLLTVT